MNTFPFHILCFILCAHSSFFCYKGESLKDDRLADLIQRAANGAPKFHPNIKGWYDWFYNAITRAELEFPGDNFGGGIGEPTGDARPREVRLWNQATKPQQAAIKNYRKAAYIFAHKLIARAMYFNIAEGATEIFNQYYDDVPVEQRHHLEFEKTITASPPTIDPNSTQQQAESFAQKFLVRAKLLQHSRLHIKDDYLEYIRCVSENLTQSWHTLLFHEASVLCSAAQKLGAARIHYESEYNIFPSLPASPTSAITFGATRPILLPFRFNEENPFTTPPRKRLSPYNNTPPPDSCATTPIATPSPPPMSPQVEFSAVLDEFYPERKKRRAAIPITPLLTGAPRVNAPPAKVRKLEFV